MVTGFIALMSGLFQINAVWHFGPYNPSQVSAGSQPDLYLAWADGMLRICPAWEVYLGTTRSRRCSSPAPSVWALLFTLLIAYPFIERKFSKDTAHHNLLQRPRDAPVRTAWASWR